MSDSEPGAATRLFDGLRAEVKRLRESNAAMERVLAHIGRRLGVKPGDVPSLLEEIDRLPKGNSGENHD